MNLLSILLQAAPATSSPNPLMQILPIALVIGVFYFFMVRPQQKKAKDANNFRSSVGPGMDIVTIGGMHGKIKDVKGTTFIIEIAPNVKVEIEKTAINAELTKALNTPVIQTAPKVV